MRLGGCAIVAAALASATPALAEADKVDFETCDGLQAPGKQADGMRPPSSVASWGMAGDRNGASIAACTRALASPRLLPTQTLRRVHLLRARAAANMASDAIPAAIADLEAAEAAGAPLAGDPFYKRSMGVSLSLLRAIALARQGDVAAAGPLARAAMAARPYALHVQLAGVSVLEQLSDGGVAAMDSVVRLDPDLSTKLILLETAAGHHAKVLELAPRTDAAWPVARLAPMALAVQAPDGKALLRALTLTLHTAYARAATGDAAGARRDVVNATVHLDALLPVTSVDPKAGAGSAQSAAFVGMLNDNVRKFAGDYGRLVEARIAIDQKRPAEALAAIGTVTIRPGVTMPYSGPLLDVTTKLRPMLTAEQAQSLPDTTSIVAQLAKARGDALVAAIPLAMIVPETPRAVIDYNRARPNILGALVGGALSMGTSLLGGIKRTDGFRSTLNPDGTQKVEFIGNSSSPTVIQEMTLLRAAEVTRGAGKAAFAITTRADYSRQLVQSQYGREISRTPTGFKSELTIRPLDSGADTTHAIDATAVIDALGPLYYEEKKPAA